MDAKELVAMFRSEMEDLLVKERKKIRVIVQEIIDENFEDDDEDDDSDDDDTTEDKDDVKSLLKTLTDKLTDSGNVIDIAKTGVTKLRKERDMDCIAPGCNNRSKGPRNHYLCEKHSNVPESKWKGWQKQSRAARIA